VACSVWWRGWLRCDQSTICLASLRDKRKRATRGLRNSQSVLNVSEGRGRAFEKCVRNSGLYLDKGRICYCYFIL